MPYPAIDPRQLQVFPLSERTNRYEQTEQIANAAVAAPTDEKTLGQIDRLATHIIEARRAGASVMLTYGAHLIRNGGGPLINCLIEKGFLTHVATQGAGVIHDWEYAFQGRTCESVRENAPEGMFGAWDETGRWLNFAVLVGATEGLGMGESIGRMVAEGRLVVPSAEKLREEIVAEPSHPLTAARADLLCAIETYHLPTGELKMEYRNPRDCVAAAAYRNHIPFTVHPGIGYDIIVNHPLYHGGAIGRTSATDARVFAASCDRLDGGVYMSVGCAIMSPQVYEKAFSAVNNLRKTENRPLLRDYYLAIVDIQDGGGWDWAKGEPPNTNPAYYLRFCKSFYRMCGTLDYVHCDNRQFLAQLVRRITKRD